MYKNISTKPYLYPTLFAISRFYCVICINRLVFY